MNVSNNSFSGQSEKELALYIHIPFCARICPYCDFAKVAVPKVPEDQYTNALLTEMLRYKELLKEREIVSLFFGGGTPSLFSVNSFSKIIDRLKELTTLSASCEISLELNPEHGTKEYIHELSQRFNRISIGAQSLNDKVLKKLGRKHTKEEVLKTIEQCAHFPSIITNIDLMYGCSEQTEELLLEDITTLCALTSSNGTQKIQHFSLYELTIEPGTPYFTHHAHGRISFPDEEHVISCAQSAYELLEEKNGYQRYEVSNFALPEKECRHNLRYWHRQSYLGLGAGAHSFIAEEGTWGTRWGAFASPDEYCKRVKEGQETKAWRDILDEQKAFEEIMMLGLRTTQGVSLTTLKHYQGWEKAKKNLMTEAVLKDKVQYNGETLSLTQKGRLLINSVLECLLTGP